MSSFASSLPYTPVQRRSKADPLTPDQVKYILENPHPTGYTYARSSSYSANNPRDYIHPNIGRRPLLRNGSYSSTDSYSYQSYSDEGNFISRFFYFIFYMFTSVISFFKNTTVWIFSTVLSYLIMFTPLYPVYLAYQKGTNVLSFIPIAGEFVKNMFVIGYRCIEDLISKNGYMLNQLQYDIRRTFWSLLGYEYAGSTSTVRIEEIEEDNEPVIDRSSSSISKRALDSAIYATTLGNYPKNLAGRGVAPPSRSSHRTRHGNKSRILSFLLSIAGMAYYVVSGQFLFENLHTREETGVMTRRQQEQLKEEKRKFNWMWLFGLLLLFLALWWMFAPPMGANADNNLSYPGKIAHGIGSSVNAIGTTVSSLTHWIWTRLLATLFWIPSAFSQSGNTIKNFAHHSNDIAAKAVHDIGHDTYDYLSSVKDVPEFVSNATTEITSKAWKVLSAPLSYGYDILSYPLIYGWNSTKTVFSHARPFAHFVSDDVKHLSHSVSEGGDTVYGYISSFVYWVVSKIMYGILWVWYTFVAILRLPYYIFSNTFAYLTRPHTLPLPPQYPSSNNEKKEHVVLSTSDEDLDARIRRLINVVLNEKKGEWKNEFMGIVEDEVAKSDRGTISKEAQLQQLRNLEDFKKNIEITLLDRINQFGSTIRTEIYSKFEQQQGDQNFLKMRELHSEVDHLKAQLAAVTGLGSKLRKELSEAINQLTESQNKRYEEYQLRLRNLDTIPSSENYETKFNQWENELDTIRKEIRSIAAVSQEADDVRTFAAKDMESRQIETIINTMFEKERETIRLEKEQLNKVIEERMSGKSEASLPLSQEDITRLVQESIGKLNLSALVDEVVKYHVKSQITETEHRSSSTYNEFIENKLRSTIFEVLRKFNYDKTGEPDFALESAGGHVLSTRCTENYDLFSRRESVFGIPLWYTSYSPRSVIQRQSQNVNAGECWAIKGSEAYLVIKLVRRIDVTAVSYEHLPRELSISGNMDSAPNNFKIYSLESENDANKFLLGEYVFDDQGEPLQRFEVQYHDPRGTPILEFEVNSNYGAAFTCLYRFRVHGNPL